MPEKEILTFEEWWSNDASDLFREEAKEAARYAWNHSWRTAARLLEQSL